MQKGVLQAAVLDVLNDFEVAVPERTIVLAMHTLLRISITYTDLRILLKTMEEKHLVAGTASEELTVWVITPDGRLLLGA